MNLKSSPTSVIIFVAGIIAAILGLLVMLGWHLHSEALVQVLPLFAPMQYNTALCILLSGLALLAIRYNSDKKVVVCAGLLLVIGIMTLIEYAAGINLGIDELFMEHYITVRTSHPGRMAPNTALCFTLTGIALLLLATSKLTHRKSFAVSILGALIVGLSTVALFGYTLAIEATYGWGEATRMAVHTATGFAVIGSGLLASLWQKELLSKRPNFYWLPLPVGIAALTVSLCLWHALTVQEHVRTTEALQVEADNVNNTTNAILNSSILALKRMGDRWSNQDKESQVSFEDDARNYVKHFPQMEALAWIDPSTQLRWVVTEKELPSSIERLLQSSQDRFSRVEFSKTEDAVSVSDILDLESGKKCFLIFFPLEHGERFDGFLIGVYRLDGLIDYALGKNFDNYFLLSVLKDNKTIYSNSESERVGPYRQNTELTLYNRTWNMQLYPTQRFLSDKETALPLVSLLFGVVFTILLIIAIGLSQTTRRRAVQLKRLNEDLIEKSTEQRQSEMFWRTVFKSVNEVVMIVNKEAEILYVNDAASGYDFGFQLNTSVYDHIEEERTQVIRESLVKVFDTRKPTSYDFTTRHSKGMQRLFSCSVNPIFIDEKMEKAVIIASDVTEQTQAKEKLAAQEHLYRTLIETIPHIIWLADKVGEVTFLNSAWYKLTGRSKKASLGTGWKDHLHPNDIEEFMTKRNQAGRRAEAYYGECRFMASSGEYRIFDYAGTPVLNPEGNITNWVGMYVDVTENKQAAAEIIKLNEELEDRVSDRTAQLEASNRELEAFSYSVSHDLRAPLRHMNGFAEALRENVEDVLDSESARYLQLVLDAGHRMGKLIDDLLAFSRMGRAQFSRQMVNLNELTSEVCSELKPEMAGRCVHWDIGSLPNVIGDRAMLKQVLINLLSNAIKYSSVREEARIEVGELEENHYPDGETQQAEAVVFIRDNGAGFDMAYVDKLFGLFQRLHRANEFEGTGVGLANSKRIIIRHGGRIWAEGEIDQGATFYFSLPNIKEGISYGHIAETHPVG